MKLTDLDPQFLKRLDANSWQNVDNKAEATGIRFLCPKCFKANNGSTGTHSIICWDPTVPQDTRPTPGRWSMDGSSFDDLTLRAGSSSIKLEGGCEAHFYITNGEIISA